MISNKSDSAKTIKEMYNDLASDQWSIDKALYFCSYENASVVQLELLLDKYNSYLSQFVTEIKLDYKYYYNPQLFAQEYYGTPELDFLVLYYAGLSSIFEFNKPKIKVFDYSHLSDINKLFTKYREEIKNSKANPPEYTSEGLGSTSSSSKYLQ